MSLISWLVTLLTVCIANVAALQCYVCNNEIWWNQWSCTQNLQTCTSGQDTCATYISTTVTTDPYWAEYGYRMSFITKGCSSYIGCTWNKATIQSFCVRNQMYRDWSCVDCCQNDYCNYWVTLGASSTRFNCALLAGCLLLSVLRFFRLV